MKNDTICINIKYHKIGEVFNYKVGMSEMTLRVDKCDRCSGCAFENYIYDCVKSGCLGCEREDVFEEAMYNEATLKEEFTSSVRLAVVRELKEKFKNELMREISNPISEKIEDIARESMNDLVENASEKKYRFRLDYMDEELIVDEFIRGRMKKVVDRNIETMVESKAKSFVNELRKRYDMAFAAFIVDNMRKQNMLKDEKIAELLKDNPDER